MSLHGALLSETTPPQVCHSAACTMFVAAMQVLLYAVVHYHANITHLKQHATVWWCFAVLGASVNPSRLLVSGPYSRLLFLCCSSPSVGALQPLVCNAAHSRETLQQTTQVQLVLDILLALPMVATLMVMVMILTAETTATANALSVRRLSSS